MCDFVLYFIITVSEVVQCSYRPDLIDWARVCLQTPRENLQLAFDIAERVYNVTRLLDPEGDDDIVRVLSRHLLGGKLPPKLRNFPPKKFWPGL